MASIRDIYRSSDTLAASDLPAGVRVPVVIEAVRAVRFDDGNKLELRFRGKHKVLMANKTNAMRIADQHGDDFDAWPGKMIFLQRDQTEFKGQLVDCVRVVRQPIARPASQIPPLSNPPVKFSAIPSPAAIPPTTSSAPRVPNAGGEYSYRFPPSPAVPQQQPAPVAAPRNAVTDFEAERQRALELQGEGNVPF